jgi:hypothetical protein
MERAICVPPRVPRASRKHPGHPCAANMGPAANFPTTVTRVIALASSTDRSPGIAIVGRAIGVATGADPAPVMG